MGADLDFCPDPPRVRIWPVRGRPGLTQALMWDDLVPGLASADGGALACPWCGLSSTLRLAWIHVATPSPGQFRPAFGVDIDVQAAMVTFPGVHATNLHAEANTGVMLAIECWCGNGCRGRLEFRQHVDPEDGADVLVLNVVETSPVPLNPDDIDPDDEPGHGGLVVTADDADPDEPPF
jgi:hypothetical protein